ncbi:MAG TPA: C2 family cysteine protease [Burkholderiaceae bacterium]|nr:C2 family cysteine protease [Burkholderiaceae bacterium]
MTSSASPAWIPTVADAALRTDLTAMAADGTLSYAEALQLLSGVTRDGTLTSAELQGLRTVASHLNNGLTASSYVADIFLQTVQGNPANVSWHGGTSTATPLGNLQPGSTAAQLNELIGKWFLGSDLPDPTSQTDGKPDPVQPHYASTAGPLYGGSGTAAIVDVAQGAVGDCVVCASMIEMVGNHPDLLRSMIVDNGNGSYGVRFYLDGNEVWVTVDDQLPVDADGRLVYAHNGTLQEKALWAPLIEKAYAQLSETGMVAHPMVNSYANIDGNTTGTVLPAMTDGHVTYYDTSAFNWTSQKDALVRALAQHRDVVLETAATGHTTYDNAGQTLLVAAHAYAILGYDDATGNFIVRNPWGDSYARQDWTAQFEVSMQDMWFEGGAVAVADAAGVPAIRAAAASFELGIFSQVAVAPLFSVFNPDALPVSRYLFHVSGGGTLHLNGASDLATAQQRAAGDVVIGAADLARLQFGATMMPGSATLSVQALLGQQWSAATDIGWTFDALAGDTVLLPKARTSVDAGGSVALASLFQLDGASFDQSIYSVRLRPGEGGSIELNGARNLWTGADPGQYEFSAADMQRVTYRAPSSQGTVKLLLDAYHGGGWGGDQQVLIHVGGGDVAHTLQNYANGQLAAIGAVADSAAAIFGQLDGLEALLRAGLASTIEVSDSAPQRQTITAAQYAQDRGVLASLAGDYSVTVTDVAPTDAGRLSADLGSHLASATVSGSAAGVFANLDGLQALAAQGKLSGLHLTDAQAPALTLTAAQLVADAAVLHAIDGPYRLAVAGVNDSVARFVIQQDGGLRGAGTAMTPLAAGAAAAAGANTVVGFQNATLGHGYNAVVLDQARDHYALRADSTGKLEIENVAAGDAGYGQRVTITGADYLVFNGAAATDAGFYPDMYFLVDSHNAAVAELYMAALGRQPRLTGLEFWENQLAAGVPLADIAAGFIGSAEFRSRYPSAATPSDHGGAGDLAFVNALYQNVLHRAPKAAGLAFWVNDLAHGDSRANVLVAFATSPEDETNTHAAPGHADGWLIDSGKGGYADPALRLDAATALNQGLSNGYLNTALIDPATVGAGVKAGAAALSGNTLTLGAALAPQSVVLSDAVNHVVVNGGGQQIYSGGHAAITIQGAGNAVHVAGADQLDLLGGSDSTVTGFVTGTGSTLHLAYGADHGAPVLVEASVARIAATSLSFEAGHGYVIRVGSLGDGSADAAAAAINRAYTVAGSLAEHATFIGQDAGGNMQAWLFGQAGGDATVAADHNGNHQVDGAELLHLVTLVGVNPALIGAADLA